MPYRIIPNISFAIDWWRGKGTPKAFLQTNILIHIINAFLVMSLMIQVFKKAGESNSIKLLLAASISAAIWALHPLQSQAVLLIVQRMSSLAAIFTFLTVSSYLAARASKRKRKTRVVYYTATVIFLLLGAITKENTWIAPLLVMLAEYGVIRHGRNLVENRIDYFVLALPVFAFIIVCLDILSGIGPVSAYILPVYEIRDFSLVERLMTQSRVIFFYLFQFFWPLPDNFSIEHGITVSRSLLDPPQTVFCIIGLAIIFLYGLRKIFNKNCRIFGFFLIWIPTTLAIESSIVPLEMVFEHRMYLPSFGLAGLIGMFMLKLFNIDRKSMMATTVVGSVILLILGGFTSQRVPVWKSDQTLYSDALEHAPESARVWSNLGIYNFYAGDLVAAERELLTAIRIDPDHHAALENLGLLRLQQGSINEAETLLFRAIRANDGFVTVGVTSHLGEIAMSREEFELAQNYFLNAQKLEPWDPVNHWNLALAYEKSGQCGMARQYWQMFMELTNNESDRLEVESHINENYREVNGICFETTR